MPCSAWASLAWTLAILLFLSLASSPAAAAANTGRPEEKLHAVTESERSLLSDRDYSHLFDTRSLLSVRAPSAAAQSPTQVEGKVKHWFKQMVKDASDIESAVVGGVN